MKKRGLVLALAVLLGLSTAAFAAGPTIGLSVVPAPNQLVGFSLGYNFLGDWGVELVKGNFETWIGEWTIGPLWRPEIQTPFQDTIGPVHLRAGLQTKWYWHSNGVIDFRGFGLSVGIQKTWNILSLFGELRFTPTGLITPAIGVQVEIPVGGDQAEESTL